MIYLSKTEHRIEKNVILCFQLIFTFNKDQSPRERLFYFYNYPIADIK